MTKIDSFEDLCLALYDAATSDWNSFANCRGLEEGYSTKVFIEEGREEEAKAFCDGCAVQLECIEDAIKWDDGGFRGISEKDRKSVVRHRSRYYRHFFYDLESAGIGIEG